MSKWFRRVSGQTTTTTSTSNNNAPFSSDLNMPVAAPFHQTANYTTNTPHQSQTQVPPPQQHQHHQQQQQPMVGYVHAHGHHHPSSGAHQHHHHHHSQSPSPATVAMDMDTGIPQRTKYATPGSSSGQQPRPRSLREDPDHNNGKNRSSRSSSRDGRRSRSSRKSTSAASGTTNTNTAMHYQQQPPPNTNNPGSRSSRMTSSINTPSSNNHFSSQTPQIIAPHQQQAPPQTSSQQLTPHSYGAAAAAGGIITGGVGGGGIYSKNPASPPLENMQQPTFPPPAVTNDSPITQPQIGDAANQSNRRPAYLLHRDLVIGKGSYGQVCIASRGEPEGHSSNRSGKRKKFACKCVMLRNDPKYIAKLQEEVNVLRELRGHDNIIRLYDVFCVDNELFIITELGRGGDLFHLLTTHPKHGVTEAYAAKTVAEMLSSVAFLHARSICHRDLKLENWVLESGKDVWSPLKLIDFGLSTHYTRGQRLSRVVGSSYYVAPEVLKKSYTEACDLWSLGVIVYMLLSGAPPFYGKNDEAIKASIVQGEYTFPHELFRDVSDEAMAFVSTLLSYNIEYRYTAEQALTHPWLAANCDPDLLQRAKDGARGIGIDNPHHSSNRPEPMQL